MDAAPPLPVRFRPADVRTQVASGLVAGLIQALPGNVREHDNHCSPSPCGSVDSDVAANHPGHKGLGYRITESLMYSSGAARPQLRIFIGGLCLFVALCQANSRELAAADGDAIRLTYKFQPNDALYLEYKQDMKMDIRGPGIKRTMHSQTVADKHLRIISVDDDGNALVEPVIDRTRMTSRQDQDPESKFDSKDGPDNCPSEYRGVLATVGRPLVRIKFAANGKLLEATGVNGGSSAVKAIEQDPALNFLIVFPEQPVKIDDTWKDEFEAIALLDKTLKQGVKLRREYRLVKLDGSRAEIELKTACLTPLRDPKIEMQISSRLLSGTIVFDHQLGQIVSREMRVESQVINGIGPNTSVSTAMTQSERNVPNPKLANREK